MKKYSRRAARSGSPLSPVGCAVVVLLTIIVNACTQAYRPPTVDEPHALVKLRRTYEKAVGSRLTETAAIEGQLVLHTSAESRTASTPRTDALLVHPLPAPFVFAAKFTHWELRSELETRYEQETYWVEESYECGSYDHPRSCTRSAMRFRSVPKQQQVTNSVEVADGECSRALQLAPSRDHVYLLQFTYQDSGACALSCYEQVATGDTGVEQRPCPTTVVASK